MAIRVCLTGATGFVGSGALRALCDAGCEVRALLRGPRAVARLAALDARAAAIAGDLRDEEARSALLRGAEQVLHLAAVVDPALAGDETLLRAVNEQATLALAREARAAGARRFVFVSSIAALGIRSGVATPSSACQPDTAYGRSKLLAERGVLALATRDFDVVVLRPPTVYGPGERYNFLGWARAVDAGLYRVIGAGDNVLPLCTADNLARALVAAALGGVPPGVHLVADREPYAVRRIHAALCGALGRPVPVLHLPHGVARVAGLANELGHKLWPRLPLLLTRQRVVTLTADQRFDVSSLLAAGVALDAPLEREVARTIADQRSRGLLPARSA